MGVLDATTGNDDVALTEKVSVLDPRHPLYGRTFTLAERRAGEGLRRERITVFMESGLTVLPMWALRPPDPQDVPTKLSLEGVMEFVETARTYGLIVVDGSISSSNERGT